MLKAIKCQVRWLRRVQYGQWFVKGLPKVCTACPRLWRWGWGQGWGRGWDGGHRDRSTAHRVLGVLPLGHWGYCPQGTGGTAPRVLGVMPLGY